MRKTLATAFVLAATLALPTEGSALEKAAARLTDDARTTGWTAGTTCSVSYYNTCTGWIWIWSGWASGDQVGVQFDNCCGGNGTLDSNFTFAWTGAPTGYGFTGTIDVLAADASGCPTGAPIAGQPFLPVSGWNQYAWGVNVPSSFVIQTTMGTSPFPNPLAFASDHPAAGPTGPAAAGTCFPANRAPRSHFYGNAASPICPGSSLADGVADAELLWDAQLSQCPVSVNDATWGQIKNLYR